MQIFFFSAFLFWCGCFCFLLQWTCFLGLVDLFTCWWQYEQGWENNSEWRWRERELCQRRLGRSIQTKQIQPDSCRRFNRARKSKSSFPKLSKLGTILLCSVLYRSLLHRFSDSPTLRESTAMNVVLKLRNELTALPLSIKKRTLLSPYRNWGVGVVKTSLDQERQRRTLCYSEYCKELSIYCRIKSTDVFLQR